MSVEGKDIIILPDAGMAPPEAARIDIGVAGGTSPLDFCEYDSDCTAYLAVEVAAAREI